MIVRCFFSFFSALLRVIFQVFWSKSRVLGQIGMSGKVLGSISSNFGPDPTVGRLLKGNNRGAIIIIIIPEKGGYMGSVFAHFDEGSGNSNVPDVPDAHDEPRRSTRSLRRQASRRSTCDCHTSPSLCAVSYTHLTLPTILRV